MLSIMPFAVCALLAACGGDEKKETLVAHEWGTFTTFCGPDGTPRKFTTRVGEHLPEFVYTLARQEGKDDEHLIEVLKFSRDALVRMETPVIYFYSDEPTRVNVDVRFPEGVVTEFYPPASAAEPSHAAFTEGRFHSGRLTWNNVEVLPRGSEAVRRAGTPPVASGHYEEARQTDAALLRFERNGTASFERFLFYRGIANFQPTCTLTASSDVDFVFKVEGNERPSAAYVLTMDAGTLRFARVGPVVGPETPMTLKGAISGGTAMDQLAASMAKDLVAAGLYEKEASAMVNTWRSSWFNEEGTRVLYILPPATVDAVLPLRIDPTPKETRRVFVGRIEIVTNAAQREIERALLAMDAEKANLFWQTPIVKRLGRFAGPAVKIVEEKPLDPAAGKQAKRAFGR